ncbi:MAG: hypothetical protein PHG81_11260 [Aliarcobacter sp.]|nr:hypothetical protein [Aliarcobacter sp.]
MKKNLVLLSILTVIYSGCVANNTVEKEEIKVEEVVEPVITKTEPVEEVKKIAKKKIKKISYTYYRIIPSKIEVFAYKLGGNTIIDDAKLKNSFYLSADKMKIEKIYSSKIGDEYGKIAGKNLIVSMDDLKKENKIED